MKDVCAVIPIYKEKPSEKEYKAIKNAIMKFQGINIAYIGPLGMSLDKYPCMTQEHHLSARDVFFEGFNPKFFKNVKGYSRLLLSEPFYKRFDNYQYIIIVQPDVWILKNSYAITEFFNYDYIGAPWPNGLEAYRFSFKGTSILLKVYRAFCKPRICYVGNGGFSFRNVSACRKLIRDNRLYARIWNTGEDVFFAYFGLDEKNDFKLATVEIAEKFALEQNAKEKMRMGHIPIGVHAWEKWYPELVDEVI